MIFTNASTTTFTMPDMKALKAIMAVFEARRRQDDRKVFVFDGTLDEFKASLESGGVQIVGGISRPMELEEKPPWWADSAAILAGDGLEVHEIDGVVVVGTRKAIEAYRDKDVVKLPAIAGPDKP